LDRTIQRDYDPERDLKNSIAAERYTTLNEMHTLSEGNQSVEIIEGGRPSVEGRASFTRPRIKRSFDVGGRSLDLQRSLDIRKSYDRSTRRNLNDSVESVEQSDEAHLRDLDRATRQFQVCRRKFIAMIRCEGVN
jgi:hypothetical protein